MPADYIPTRDVDAVAWMRVFSGRISEMPSAYMVAPVEAEHLYALVEDFAEAFSVATRVATRTKGSVLVKCQARAIATDLIRHIAMRIKLNRGIPNGDKVLIGVKPVNTRKSKVAVPQSPPLLSVVSRKRDWGHDLVFHDWTTPTRRAKPLGATSLQIFIHVGDVPVQDPAKASFYRAATSTPAAIGHEHKDFGKVATYFARWASRRGEVGTWSAGVAARIAG